jgi:SAM-dependent methyltransferase
MITCRRKLLDRFLGDVVPLMRGRVLDIGGKKINHRGCFRPPLHQVEKWQYLNSDPHTQPDYCCDAAQIPLDDQSFDMVVMTEVLEYLESPEVVLTEIYRLLSQNGVCVISVPFLHPIHGDYQFDRQRWTSVKLEEVCCNAGFEEVSVEPMGSVWAVLHDILHVGLSYSHPRANQMHIKILRKLLHWSTPFWEWLDTKAQFLKKYVNTGYFVVLKKRTEK